MKRTIILKAITGALVTTSFCISSAACDENFTPEVYPIGRGWRPSLTNKKNGNWMKILPPKNDTHRSVVFTLYRILEKYNADRDVFRRAGITAPIYMKLDIKCENLDNKWFLMREAGVSDNPYTGFKAESATWQRVRTYDTESWPEFISFLGCLTARIMDEENTIFYDDDTYYSKKYGHYTWEADKCGRVKL